MMPSLLPLHNHFPCKCNERIEDFSIDVTLGIQFLTGKDNCGLVQRVVVLYRMSYGEISFARVAITRFWYIAYTFAPYNLRGQPVRRVNRHSSLRYCRCLMVQYSASNRKDAQSAFIDGLPQDYYQKFRRIERIPNWMQLYNCTNAATSALNNVSKLPKKIYTKNGSYP